MLRIFSACCLWITGMILFLACQISAANMTAINFLGEQILKSPYKWHLHDTKLLPSDNNRKAAVIEFLTEKYGACFCVLDIEANWPKEFMLELTYKLSFPAANMNVRLLDYQNRGIQPIGKNLGYPTYSLPLSKTGDSWKTVVLPVSILPGTKKLDLRFDSSMPLKLEVMELSLFSPGFDAATAASAGIKLPAKVIIEGGRNVPEAGVLIPYYKNVPFELGALFWSKLKSHKLKATDQNKIPPAENDADVSFKIACDDNALYVLMEADDDNLNFDFQGIAERDSFEFYINPTGLLDKGTVYEYKDMQVIVTRDQNSESIKLGGYRLLGRSLGMKAIGDIRKNTFRVILRVPFSTDGWNMKPFNGLRFTGNVMYNDADKMPQENKLSFSNDPSGESWKDKSKFTDFVISSQEDMTYTPIILPYLDREIFPVQASFSGFFNLENGDFSKSLKNYSIWGNQTGVHYSIDSEERFNGKNSMCSDGTDLDPNLEKHSSILGSSFNVLPGETLKLTFYAKASGGTPRLSTQLLTRCNWKVCVGKVTPARLSSEWREYTATIKVPEDFIGINRQVRLFLTASPINNTKIWIADRKIVRMLPEDIDIRLRTPDIFAHFNVDKPQKLLIDIRNGKSSRQKVKIKCRIRDYFTKEEMLFHEWELDLPTDTEEALVWDFNLGKTGFFNTDLEICRMDGSLTMRRQLAFSSGQPLNGMFSDFFGIEDSSDFLVFDSESFLKFMLNCGINKYYLSVSGGVTGRGEMNFDFHDEKVNNLDRLGFEILSKVGVSAYGTREIEQRSDIIYTRACQTTAHYKGKIGYFCFGNEPNIIEGWPPKPDGREWANVYRCAYNGAMTGNPNVKVFLGDLNNMPVEFLRDYYSENGSCFAGPIIGVHPYRYNYDDDAFEQLLADRNAFHELIPQNEVWDTESGAVYLNYPLLMNLVSKKEPTLRAAGISRHYFYSLIDMFCPYSDSTPLLPIRTFQTLIYNKTAPLGKIIISDDLCGFLFSRENGRGLAVLWSKVNDKLTVDLPVTKDAKVYDMFGNILSICDGGQLSLDFEDTYVKYIDGAAVSEIINKYKFIKGFDKKLEPRKENDYVSNPYLIIEPFQGFFTRDLPLGQENSISVLLRNDSDKPSKVKITLEQDSDAVLLYMSSPSEIELKPNSKAQISVKCTPLQKFSNLKLQIGGNVDGGKKMVPLTFTLNTAPAIIAEGYSKLVTIKNNSSETSEMKVSFERHGYYFKPVSTKISLAAGKSEHLAFEMEKACKANDLKDQNAFKYTYFISLSSFPNKNYAGYCYKMTSETEKTYTAFDFSKNLKYDINPEPVSEEKFRLSTTIRKGSDYIRILAKVHDPSPLQRGVIGELRNEGDCLVIGIDMGEVQKTTSYGNGDFEVGFALREGKPETYIWNGKNGLESAHSASEMAKLIKREGDDVFYDIVIPVNFKNGIPDEIGLSLLAINRTKSGKNEICVFGAGLDGDLSQRDMSKFGILELKK